MQTAALLKVPVLTTTTKNNQAYPYPSLLLFDIISLGFHGFLEMY